MRKIYFISVLLCIAFLGSCRNTEPREFAGGNGSVENPYRVATAEHLNNVRNHMNAHFKQTGNIDLSPFGEEKGWEPIGLFITPGHNDNNPFTGSYDGNGYTIRNLVINRPDTIGMGFFGYIDENARLTRIYLEDIDITGQLFIGGLVAISNESIISDCYSTGKVLGRGTVGGLVGEHHKSSISRCYSFCMVTGEGSVGGLVGGNSNSSISESFAGGNVRGSVFGVGGLVGCNWEGSGITKSFAIGNVSGGENWTGGLVGANGMSLSGTAGGDITNSYARGNVTGKMYTGGLAGENFKGNIFSCYAAGRVKGSENIGGLVGWTDGSLIKDSYHDLETTGCLNTAISFSKSTAEMKREVTFENWDFENIWEIKEEETYPYLKWIINLPIDMNTMIQL